MYGGTVLGQALWFACHADPARIGDYARVIDVLIEAGSQTDASPKMMELIDEVRRRAASHRA